MRRIGVLMNATADEDQQAIVTAFLQVLQQLGWTDGCNVRIEFRWGEGNAEQYRKIAAELVALAPDVIVALGTRPWVRCNALPENVPIVFVNGRSCRPTNRLGPVLRGSVPALYDSCAAGPFRPTLT